MKLIITVFAVIFCISSVVSNADTDCENCIAVVDALSNLLTSQDSLASQVAVLLAEVCPMDEEPEVCAAQLPELWPEIALILWPGYFDPAAEWMCGSDDLRMS